MNEIEELVFEEITPIGFKVSVTKSYWEYITTVKHPHIKGKEYDVITTLKNPEFIRQSRIDRNVYLFYREVVTN